MGSRYEDLANFSQQELEDELNFYDFLMRNQDQLGGVEMKHTLWYNSLKVESKRRGLKIERHIKLIKDK